MKLRKYLILLGVGVVFRALAEFTTNVSLIWFLGWIGLATGDFVYAVLIQQPTKPLSDNATGV